MIMKPMGMLLGMLALLALAGTASAQIAAPRLNETTPAVGSPFNPAVMPWNEVSQAGIVIQNGITRENTPSGGSTTETATGDGVGVQFRGYADPFAGGLEYASEKLDRNPDPLTLPLGGTEETKQGLVSLGVMVADWITVGLGYETRDVTETDAANPPSKSTKSSMPSLGGTLRFGDAIYVGGTYGQRTIDYEEGTRSGSSEGGVGRVGVGFHTRKDDRGFHLEVYRESEQLQEMRDLSCDNPATPQVDLCIPATEGATTGVTLELMYANVLVGVEALNASIDFVPVAGGLDTHDINTRRVSLAWVPQKGFSIGVAGRSREDTNNTSNDVDKDTSTELTVAWLW